MIGNWSAALAAVAALVMAPPSPSAPAAAPAVAEVSPQPSAKFAPMLATNTFPIALEGGRLVGPGAERLLAEAAQAQFLALGEEHNSRDIPAITAALFDALHARAGYNYLIDEQDPITMRWASRAPLRGNLPKLRERLRLDKHSFTFGTDQEIELLSHVGRVSTGKGRPIWGCEQVFGASHVLRAILPAAPSREARTLIELFLAESQAREARRDENLENRVLVDASAQAKMAEVVRLYANVRDPETRFLVDSLAKSFEIYGYFRNGQEGRSPGYYANNAVREEHMKALCREEYLNAERRDGKPPRAIAKLGSNHLYQGLSPTDVVSTGSFLADVARLNGLGFVSVAIISRSANGAPVWDAPNRQSLSAFRSQIDRSGWHLVDLRPFREFPAFRDLRTAGGDASEASKANLKRLVYGFDYLLFLDAYREGSYQAMDRS